MQRLFILEREKTFGSFDTPEDVVSPGFVEKLLLELEDGNAIEAIVIATFGRRMHRVLELDRRVGLGLTNHLPFVQEKIRYETCVSTQVGCALDCRFCASALVPFVRNLTVEEMLREIATVEAILPASGELKKVVFAGVGEPLMNYENLAAVVRKLSARGVVSRVNTVGVIPYLERMFAEDLPAELAVSVHAPDDDLRTDLMPVGKGYPLAEICKLLARAPERMFIEAKYLMLRGINDSLAHARALVDRLKGLPLTVGLQMYNSIEELDLLPSHPEDVRAFAAALRAGGLRVGILNSNIGEPVQGGCGQLRARVATVAGR